MIPANANGRPCVTGTLKHHPYQRIPNTNPPEYTKAYKEFIPNREGLLIGWGVEGEIAEGCEVCICGLVEFPDGSFDTFSASCIKLKISEYTSK
jgi:hypothetical protein